MTVDEIINGLQFTVDMFLFDPTTGETYTEPRNDMDKTTIDACNGAIKLLKNRKQVIEDIKAEPCEDAISRADTIEWLKRVTVTDGITFETGFKQILTDIQNMPSVTPKIELNTNKDGVKTELESEDYIITALINKTRLDLIKEIRRRMKLERDFTGLVTDMDVQHILDKLEDEANHQARPFKNDQSDAPIVKAMKWR